MALPGAKPRALTRKAWQFPNSQVPVAAPEKDGAPMVKNATANRDKAVLRKVFSRAVDISKLKDNVARPVKLLKEPNLPFLNLHDHGRQE